MGFFLTFLKSQLFVRLPYPTWNFGGQTIIVTGSNTGLGLEAARHIVRLGADKVILAVRDVSKGEAAAQDILKSTKAKANVIELWPLDLSVHESIKAFGARLLTLDRLDAFIQNAGILSEKFTLSKQSGLETHIDINTVSSVLVGLLALPKLKETSRKFGVRTRLEFVGSELYQIAQFKEAETSGSLLDVLSDDKASDMSDRYKVSKLLLFFAVREIAERNPPKSDSNVVIDYVTPGACKSDLFRDDMGWLRETIQGILVFLIARSTEAGSRTLVHAVKPDIETEAHGRFLMNCQVADNGSNVDSPRGKELQERWIAEFFPKLESISPGVTKFSD